MSNSDTDCQFEKMIEAPHPFDVEGEGAVKITVNLDYTDPGSGAEFYGAFAEWSQPGYGMGYVEIDFDESGRPSDEDIRKALRQEYDDQEPSDL